MTRPNHAPDHQAIPLEQIEAFDVALAIDMRLNILEEEVREQVQARHEAGHGTEAEAKEDEARIATYRHIGRLAFSAAQENVDGQSVMDYLRAAGSHLSSAPDAAFENHPDETLRDPSQRSMIGTHLGELSVLSADQLFAHPDTIRSEIAPAPSLEAPVEPESEFGPAFTPEHMAQPEPEVTGYESEFLPYEPEAQPAVASGNTTHSGETRQDQIERFMELAGTSVSLYSDGPLTDAPGAIHGYQGHGPSKRDSRTYADIRKQLAELPEVVAARTAAPNKSVVEIVSFTPAQEQITVMIPHTRHETKLTLKGLKTKEVIENVPTVVDVDKYDPKTGERLVRVGYSFDPRFSGADSSYPKAENEGDIPTYREVNGSRPGGQISYGLTLPESAAKELEQLFATDPGLARDMADHIFTGKHSPYSEHQYVAGDGSDNPIRPPYDMLPKPWSLHMFNALDQHRDRDYLDRLPKSRHGSSDLEQVKGQDMKSQEHPARMRTIMMP